MTRLPAFFRQHDHDDPFPGFQITDEHFSAANQIGNDFCDGFTLLTFHLILVINIQKYVHHFYFMVIVTNRIHVTEPIVDFVAFNFHPSIGTAGQFQIIVTEHFPNFPHLPGNRLWIHPHPIGNRFQLDIVFADQQLF